MDQIPISDVAHYLTSGTIIFQADMSVWAQYRWEMGWALHHWSASYERSQRVLLFELAKKEIQAKKVTLPHWNMAC